VPFKRQKLHVDGPGCWEWLGYRNPDGYGESGGRGVHRRAYEEAVGAIPDGMEIDHLCHNRACVNPAHLEVVTHAENMRRSAPATKTHCVNGHPYDEANTYWHPYDEANTYWRPSGRRDCRACIRERVRRYVSRQKEAA
jgi:hypothetical protein